MSDPFITLICDTCECLYAAYAPSMDEVEEPECSSCRMDRASLALEEAVTKHRQLRVRQRRETFKRIWNAPRGV